MTRGLSLNSDITQFNYSPKIYNYNHLLEQLMDRKKAIIMIMKSIDFEIFEDLELFCEICLGHFFHPLPYLPLLLLLSLNSLHIRLKCEKILAYFVHPQGLGQLGVRSPVVHCSHLSAAGICDLGLRFDRTKAGQDVLFILLFIAGGEPVIDEGDSHGGEGFC